MDEKQFMEDVFDVLLCNTFFVTQEDFFRKYRDYFVEIDCSKGEITLKDDNNEWRLTLQKVWSNNKNV